MNIKRMLNDELERIVPSEPSSRITSEPLPRVTATARSTKRSYNRRLLPALAACIACLVMVCVALPLAMRGGNEGSVVLMEINPSVYMVTDSDGVVTSLKSGNDDGDVVLSDGDFVNAVVGRSYTEATALLLDRVMKLGYLKETDNAVRFSVATRDEDMGDALVKSTEDFYRDKGIYGVAFDRDMEDADYGEGGAKGYLERISAMNTYTVERVSETTDIVEDYTRRFNEYASVELRALVDTLRSKKADLNEIYELNGLIEEHADNPAWLIGKDYWSNITEPRSGEFGELMGRMDMLIIAYGETYGDVPTGYADLITKKLFYDTLDIDGIADLVELCIELAESVIMDYQVVIDMIVGDRAIENKVNGLFDELRDAPDTVEEYVTDLKEMAHRSANELTARAHGFYTTSRQSIEETDYTSYTERIVGEYGNFENFWNSLNKS